MSRIWTDAVPGIVPVFVAAISALALSGCATNKDTLLPHGPRTMMDIWNGETGGGVSGSGRIEPQLLEARLRLRRPLTDAEAASSDLAAYTRDAANEVDRQFHRLPNPDLVMFVFPHLAGSDPVPVPGYTTAFPFYERVQYAMPGERLEDF